VDLGHVGAGTYVDRSKAAYWDGRNQFGERVSSGVYVYHMQTDAMSDTRKLVTRK
jgi:hypothetical protein